VDEVAKAMNIETRASERFLLLPAGRPAGWDEEADGACRPRSSFVPSRHYTSFSLPIEDKLALEAGMERLSDFQRNLVELLFYASSRSARLPSRLVSPLAGWRRVPSRACPPARSHGQRVL